MLKSEIIQSVQEMGYSITTERNQYTNKLQYVVYTGNWEEGIFTLVKGSLKTIKEFIKKGM